MRSHDVFLERALVEAGAVTAAQVDEARRYAAERDLSTIEALVETEVLPRRKLALTKADVCEVPYLDLADYEPSYANVHLVPRPVAERCCAFPLFLIDNVLTLAMAEPLNLDALDQVRQLVRGEVETVLCDAQQIQALIARSYSLSSGEREVATGEVQDDIEAAVGATDQPIVAAVNQILVDAIEQRASDVHINPDEHELHIRFRVDGVLHTRQGPPPSMHGGLVQRLKVMANLDLTQTRRPQDGKIRLRHHGTEVDIRMSTLPTVNGENVVLRLLPGSQAIHDFQELGIPVTTAAEIEEILAAPFGMLFVTGPTGSGKTTTLYTAINRLNDPSRNIMTIEDPVEIRMPYVRQIQVNKDIGLTFAAALRSILRQDPDVVLVGEVRDNETATIALQAALTGHLVLSTLHTNDAVGAVARLRDYGLPSFVINSAVLGVVAQRLVRRVCQHCVGPEVVGTLMRRRFALEADAGFVRGRGCNRCAQTGYRGRVGLYEFLRFTAPVQEMVEQGASVERIREHAVRKGMRLMWQDGVQKARLGLTTLEEVAKSASVIQVAGTVPESADMRLIA